MKILRNRFALAVAAGVLHFLGFIGYGIWPLALCCYVPFWLALEDGRARLRGAALLGFVFGWVSYAGGYYWLWRIVDVFLGGNLALGALIWLADSSWFALRYALYAVLYTLVRRRGWPLALAAVPTLVMVEWLYPLLFPANVGHALADQLTFIQMSDLGGPLLLTAFLALINAAVFETVGWLTNSRIPRVGRASARNEGAALLTCALAAFAVLLAWLYGTWRIADIDRAIAAAPTLRIGVVQGNLGIQEKGVQAAHDHQRYLEQTRELLAGGDVDLVVWPETVYTRGLRGPLPISGDLIRQEITTPLLFGGAFVGESGGRRVAYNSALLIGPDGVIRDVYEKNLLIPFTEYVPLADVAPSLAARFASASHFAAAIDVPALGLGAWRIATPICYEAIRPAFVRRMIVEGRANLIVTLANDAWFGDSQEPRLHLQMAKLRAVELRRYLVRATNSGVSAVVDPVGRIVADTGLLTRENLRAKIARLDAVTVYEQWGDWLGWLSAAVVLLAIALRHSPAGWRS